MYDAAPDRTQTLGLQGILQRTFGPAEGHSADSVDAPSARSGQAEGPAAGGLGSNAKYVGRSPAQELRKSLFYQQRHAAKLLPKERVGNCRWSVQRKDRPVEVHLEDGRASYAGLQTCGSVWLCPVCSRKISEVRRTELNDLLSWSRDQGFFPVMLTLTARHSREDALADQLARMKSAKRRLRQRRDWKNLKDRIVGTVTATEVTHGERAGWHTHFHEIIVVRASSEDEAVSLVQTLRNGWLVSLATEGLDGIAERAFQVQGAAAAGNYVGKWGAAEEVALAGQKKGRTGGRTAAQLLHDSSMGDERAGQLWQEFGRAFKGSRQLVWSNGFKKLIGIEEVDDEAAAEDRESDLVGLIDYETWRGSPFFPGARSRRVRILEAAETRDSLRLQSTIAGVHGLLDEPMEPDILIEAPSSS